MFKPGKWKKAAAALLAAALCVGLTACGAFGGGKNYDAVKKAQEGVGELESGRIIVTSKHAKDAKSESVVTEFVFRTTAGGTSEYCQTQFDQNNKAVYCEYSDGEKSEQWLIGNGWSVIDPTVYTKENPHRYLRLLASPFDKKLVSKIETEQEGENMLYTLTLKPDRVNENLYPEANVEIKEERVSILVNAEGKLIAYGDVSQVYDKEAGEDCEYTLDMQLSDLNAVTEIKKPELRDYAKK